MVIKSMMPGPRDRHQADGMLIDEALPHTNVSVTKKRQKKRSAEMVWRHRSVQGIFFLDNSIFFVLDGLQLEDGQLTKIIP